jgi:hypothetical protein
MASQASAPRERIAGGGGAAVTLQKVRKGSRKVAVHGKKYEVTSRKGFRNTVTRLDRYGTSIPTEAVAPSIGASVGRRRSHSVSGSTVTAPDRKKAKRNRSTTTELPTTRQLRSLRIDALYARIAKINTVMELDPNDNVSRLEMAQCLSELRQLQQDEATAIELHFKRTMRLPFGVGAQAIQDAKALIAQYANPSSYNTATE